jgi:predicted metal-dependent hydrolase
MSNSMSFMAGGFEHYLLMAVKDALKVRDDPELRSEAEVFVAQEAQHSAAHRKHVNAMIAQHPVWPTPWIRSMRPKSSCSPRSR